MREIFVFGSNLAGIHGAGAARYARENHGAIMGQGIGLQGSSYGIPTKDKQIRTLPLRDIQEYVNAFILYANAVPNLRFNVTRIGCGLAGYTDAQIAPLFASVVLFPVPNVRLPNGWRELIATGETRHISDEWEPFPPPTYDEALENLRGSITSFKEFLAKPIE